MANRTVVEVFTNKSKDFMLEHGGSASWVMSVTGSVTLDYCVCSRNDEHPREDDPGARPERRNQAFLVGKVSGIEFVERQNGRDRYLIKFSEYAEVSIDDFRHGTTRNPVVYSNEESCRLRGLDFDALDFKPMPSVSKPYSRTPMGSAGASEVTHLPGLSIAEAKQQLALRYGVSVEAIQVIISG